MLPGMRILAIIATYNEERFIGGCLEHLFSQGVEAYLCDNQSTDGTREWLDTLTDPRIRVLDADDDDPAPTNFTKVCEAAEGEWVKFLCADDYLLHVAVESAAALRDLVLEHLQVHPGVRHTETQLVFEVIDGAGLLPRP